jgi:nickel/cobalt exporter
VDISAVYFPSAVALGALHALEPGHAKTLTAAYLIGTKGTKRDAVLLGLSVAFTHSIVVIGLCVGAVLLGREAFTDEAARWLAVVSGAVVVALGCWLLVRRLKFQRRAVHMHAHAHSHIPAPVAVAGRLRKGSVEIIDTPAGERLRLTMDAPVTGMSARVEIVRGQGRTETLALASHDDDGLVWLSNAAPAEPHEFHAAVVLAAGGVQESLPFEINEPAYTHDPHHAGEHDHDTMTDDAHARAHAAALPRYVGTGARPTPLQVMVFGAAGGMIPCPAAVTVMLLSISVARTANGLFLVAGFSIGLATTLVGIGLAVVMGLSRLSGTDRFSAVSRYAPVISASLVIVSGGAGLIVALVKGH